MKKLLIDINLASGDVIEQDASFLLVPEFRALYKDEDFGGDAIRWIVCMYDYNSPYIITPEKIRTENVNKDVFGKKTFVKLNRKVMQDAIAKYREMMYDPLIEQYYVYNEKLAQLNSYLSELKIKDIKQGSKVVTTAEQVAEKMAKLLISQEKIVDAREKLKKKIISQGEDELQFFGGKKKLSWLDKQST